MMRDYLLLQIKLFSFLVLVFGGINEVVVAAVPKPIPEKVLIGYASHDYEKVRRAVRHDGVNIVIWAFASILRAPDVNVEHIFEDGFPSLSSHRILSNDSAELHPPHVTARLKTGLQLHKIKTLIEELNGDGFAHVLHLVSLGGWNAPHLDPSLTAREWYDGWKRSPASNIFHGIDWDFEGHDDLGSPNNVFTVDCLEKMGEISRLMKSDGYIVTMAPPQSYLNFNDSNFSRFVNHTDPTRQWHGDFEYFGQNVYAYLLAAHGDFIDLVSVQLYESYSDAAMAVYHFGISGGEYLYSFVYDLAIQKKSEIYIDFSQDATLNIESQLVQLPLSKLVIGLANGWALKNPGQYNEKTVFIFPDRCKEAYIKLKQSKHGDLTPRGFMIWIIDEEGTNGVDLARGINEFLHHDL